MKRVIGGTTLRNINVQIGDRGQIRSSAAANHLVAATTAQYPRPVATTISRCATQQEIAEAATATSRVDDRSAGRNRGSIACWSAESES